MRADRLLALLMLLQRHECLTAERMAEQLEVSVRTVYRDIDALAGAGVPVYAEHGHGGGYRLVEEYRTGLTGLTQDDLSALLLVSVPESLAGLEAGRKLKAALLKLDATRAVYAAGAAQAPRICLDWAWWGQGGEPAAMLQELYHAVTRDRKVLLRYRLWNHVRIKRVVEPYGLAGKGGAWYLVYVAGGPPRAIRVADLREVRVLDEPFVRTRDFDLSACWQALCRELEAGLRPFLARLCVAPEAMPVLSRQASLSDLRPADARGWTEVEAYFESFESARTAVLGLGSAVEVAGPEALRLSVQDFARQVLSIYSSRSRQYDSR